MWNWSAQTYGNGFSEDEGTSVRELSGASHWLSHWLGDAMSEPRPVAIWGSAVCFLEPRSYAVSRNLGEVVGGAGGVVVGQSVSL